ncbi:MAG: flagellar hook protein FlgE [Nitrospinaceae bacterium]|nr:MAG: flagellar hook protein FlgE [Nitrospinaceae bacterium]
MALISALFTGVSGLTSNSQALNIIGDNIANVNTVGFKGSKAVFSDTFSTLLANGDTTSQVGTGSQLQSVLQSFTQGAFESSSNALDMAVDGSGFFIVNNGIGNFYTRNGQFRLNDQGLVQSSTGETLQGFQITNGVTSSSLTSVDLAGVQSAPQASTTFTLGANLNSASSGGTTFTSPVTLFNSVGTQVIMSMTFTKATTGNTWSFVASPSTGAVTSGASGTVTFDTTGQLSAINGGAIADQTIVIDYSSSNPPANTQTLTWDLVDSTGATNRKFTGFAAQSNNNSLIQDGFPTGTLIGLSVNSAGVISGLFNNGQSDNLFQVGLADFLSPVGLNRVGQNLFAESGQSGQPILGAAETGGFGSVLGSSLELSNVDLASEFVTMIQTQQAFQASARVITTTDDLLTETVNLVR